MSFLDIVNTVWPILVAILLFCVIITIHEFGHFIFAKLFKVKVNEFSIGMGPAFFKKQKGETLYSLRLLPIGGYCAMEGEDEESTHERAFSKAKVYKRIIIVASGAVFNIILGFILMFAVVASEPVLTTSTVSKFGENAVSNSCKTPLKVNDKILSVNGRAIYSPDDVSYMLSSDSDGVVSAVVERDGKQVKLNELQFGLEEYEGRKVIKLDFYVMPENNNFFVCIKQTFLRTVSMARMVWLSLIDLVTGRYGINDLSGPVGVTKIVSGAVSQIAVDGIAGMRYMLRVLCLITVNLGVFNLLPIPALDGSRIIFLIIEGIRRKPIKHEAMVHAVGMGLLLLLMAVLVVKDLYQWIW